MAYNGWRNYETWLFNNWYGDVLPDMLTKDQTSLWDIEDFIRDLLHQVHDDIDIPMGFASDILKGALEEVDVREIAEPLWEEHREWLDRNDIEIED